MGVPETGQQAARELYAAATDSDGAVFEIAEDVARNLAAACDRLVEDLQRARDGGHPVTEVTGFANLPSGHALSRGFADKGRELFDTITAFQQTALLFKAAYLAAGKRFDEAEAANRAAVELVAARLEETR
ncbi:hypothetical protein NDR87_25635 [Nocardia sp. CDC159]|uniref:Uncharacterized protein n=1 Tax=Nocardia pulmonis TaxID=2951408 RepID=A0A9X2E652_9NOCA|nr:MULTISPECIES: hypothetical protein [Nocardia]MCM6774827.1 hypothetical protein [Nocardia pulmonis]MCM6789758.1 hypothetical protein [Nocardia sp. CDC159]